MKTINFINREQKRKARRKSSRQFPVRSKVTGAGMVLIFLLLFFVGCSPEDEDITGNNLRLQEMPYARQVGILNSESGRFENISEALHHGYAQYGGDQNTEATFYLQNNSLLDDYFDVRNPEGLLYFTQGDGSVSLAAYIFKVRELNNGENATGAYTPPQGFEGDADIWKWDSTEQLWILNVWTGLQNPDGIFAFYNPALNFNLRMNNTELY